MRRSSRYEEKPTLILARSSPPSRGSCRLELRSTLQVIGPEAYRASSSHPGPKLTMGSSVRTIVPRRLTSAELRCRSAPDFETALRAEEETSLVRLAPVHQPGP